MGVWENLPILVALPLALAAALVSGGTETRHAVTSFLAEALEPQAVDLGGDARYLLGVPTVTVLLPSPTPASIIPGSDHSALQGD
jgi:hypothetical protein